MPELNNADDNKNHLSKVLIQMAGLATGIGIMLVIAIYEHDLATLLE